MILEIPIAQTPGEAASIEVAPAVQIASMPGMSALVTFTPTEPGTYEFYCAVPGHREAGMVGTVIVVER